MTSDRVAVNWDYCLPQHRVRYFVRVLEWNAILYTTTVQESPSLLITHLVKLSAGVEHGFGGESFKRTNYTGNFQPCIDFEKALSTIHSLFGLTQAPGSFRGGLARDSSRERRWDNGAVRNRRVQLTRWSSSLADSWGRDHGCHLRTSRNLWGKLCRRSRWRQSSWRRCGESLPIKYNRLDCAVQYYSNHNNKQRTVPQVLTLFITKNSTTCRHRKLFCSRDVVFGQNRRERRQRVDCNVVDAG